MFVDLHRTADLSQQQRQGHLRNSIWAVLSVKRQTPCPNSPLGGDVLFYFICQTKS